MLCRENKDILAVEKNMQCTMDYVCVKIDFDIILKYDEIHKIFLIILGFSIGISMFYDSSS